MGCDIHWHVERQRDDGTWEYVPGMPEPGRWYELFSALAGVRWEREDPPPRFEPQDELPPDVSEGVRALFDEYYYFGTSFRTLAELQAHDWRAFTEFTRVLGAIATLGPPEKVRAVFWFDN